MLFYSLLYATFTFFVKLVSRDLPEFFNLSENNYFPSGASYVRSNCLDNKWNPISKLKCQLDIRGPCGEGQLFSFIPDGFEYEWMDVSEKTCPESIPIDCEEADEDPSEEDQSLSEVKSRHGVCLWTDPSHPCRGLPSGFRFHGPKKQCYLIDGLQNTGCDQDQVFTLLNRTHGQCRCRHHDDVMWPADGRCYRFNSRGPCGGKEWLTFNSRREIVCRSTNCPADGEHAEWTSNRIISCYRLNDQGPCPDGKFLIKSEFEVECGDYGIDEIRRALLRGSPASDCGPGMVRDRQGRCRRPFTGKK